MSDVRSSVEAKLAFLRTISSTKDLPFLTPKEVAYIQGDRDPFYFRVVYNGWFGRSQQELIDGLIEYIEEGLELDR